MDPQDRFCHNADCPARGQAGLGNIRIHSRAERRYRCTTCGQTFAETRDTPFYRLKTAHDLVTIVLVENTSARAQADTSVSKESGIDMAAPTIAGVPITYKGNPILEASVEGSRDFQGSGNSTQSNRLNGSVTATVVQNLGNGNLLVRGEKRVRLNQGDELIQVQGIVRTADIGPDNRISSDRVGDARIVYGGRGTLARSNAMGWLGRFFNSAVYPY